MTFKDIIKRDVQQTFLNVDEFSEIHTVNGKPMAVQIDNNEQIEREKRYSQHMDGIYVKQVLMYVSAEDYGPLPKQGTAVSLDKRSYRVADAIAEDGTYSITLEANRG